MSNKQSSQLTVKVYYLENGVNKEIRKFSLDEEMATNYEYLMGKIKIFFTGLLRKDVQLFWKDRDGDFILVSSDDELLELLKTVPCNTENLKLYIKEKLVDPEPTTYNHPGIICDSCDKEIIGIRYICTVCPNFDLCSKCESKGIHPIDHDMLCIKKPKTSPSNPPFIHVGFSSGGDCWSDFGKSGCPASFQSSTSQSTGNQTDNQKKDGTPSTNPAPNTNATPQFNPMFNHPPFTPPFSAPFNHPPPPFRPPFLPHFGNSAHFSTSFRPGDHSQAGTDGKANIHVFSHCQTGNKSSNDAKSANDPANNFADHIAKNIAQNFTNNPELISNMMKPLFDGNRQQSSAESGGNEKSTNGPVSTPEEVARNMAQSFASNPEFISGVMQSIFNGCPTQQSPQTPPECSQSDGKEDIKVDGFVTVHLDNESAEEKMDSESNIGDGNERRRLKYDPVAKNYVLVEHEKENLDYTEEEEYERRLNEAIRQMEAMGFNNDNGWLKQLLVSKDLDIGQVVDALKPPQG